MTARLLAVGSSGRRAAVDELGSGPPVLYLPDLVDVHTAYREWLPFHQRLAADARLIALAPAGCNDSDEDEDAETVDDVVFHVLDTLDALGIARLPVVGVGIGGWIAAELAVRHPDIVERLVLVGATGLFVPHQPIGDIFMAAHAIDGKNFRELRELLFTDPDGALAHEHVPDGRMTIDREMLRYRTYRYANRLGFRPPYLYHRQLERRLPRYGNAALLAWGSEDRFAPVAHARAYFAALPSATLELVQGAGHSLHLEQPDTLAQTITEFLTPLSSPA